jgi:hypothetical protein
VERVKRAASSSATLINQSGAELRAGSSTWKLNLKTLKDLIIAS